MATEVYIDLYATEAPYYTVTKDEDRTVSAAAVEDASVSQSLDSMRSEILSSLASVRSEILENTTQFSTLAATAAEIQANISAANESVMASIRGDNAGPTTVLRYAKADYTLADAWDAKAAKATGTLKSELTTIAKAERAYAAAVASAKQLVQDAATGGADWLLGDAVYTIAVAARDKAIKAAAAAYNSALPWSWRALEKAAAW